MDVGSTLRVLLRRWLVLLLGTALTVGAAYYVYAETPPRYQATTRMLLLLPANARGEVVGSPFLHLPGGLNVLAEMVSLTPRASSFRADMVEQGFDSQYEIGVDEHAPVLTISVEGGDPQDVIATRDRVVATIQDELRRVQLEEQAPPQQVASTRVYAAEPTPDQMGGDRMRAVLAVLAAGGLLTLLLVFMVDRLVQVVRAHRATRRLVHQPDTSGTPHEVTHSGGQPPDVVAVDAADPSRSTV